MRTPNAACIICEKPLYRRPYELARVRYAACMEHRAKAQSVVGVTEAQRRGLALGAKPGENYRNGRVDTAETRAKRAAALALFHAENPQVAIERGKKTRGPLNIRWNGGSAKFNTSIRQLTEHRKWMDAVKSRDGKCVRCGSGVNLESHHITELAELIERHGIKTRDEARETPELWDIANGETLCRRCHYAHHGRAYSEDQ